MNIRFGAAWFAITLAPSLAIRYIDWHDYVHDRYLYFPMVGLALIAAVILGRIRITVPRMVTACALGLLLCWGTELNMRIWKDNISLFSRAIDTAPGNPFPRNDLAKEYIKAHREREAFPILEGLIRDYPRFSGGYENMAYYYQQIGNREEAKRYLEMSVSLSN
jgi:tetratricopeptide (TPR) repeat protein